MMHVLLIFKGWLGFVGPTYSFMPSGVLTHEATRAPGSDGLHALHPVELEDIVNMFQQRLFLPLLLATAFLPVACAGAPATGSNSSDDANLPHPLSEEDMKIARQTALFSWMMNYYQEPSAKDFKKKIKEFSRAGLLDSNSYMMGTLGFVSRIFMDHDSMVPEWMEEVGKLPPRQQLVFIASLRMCDTPNTNAILDDKVTDGNEVSRIYQSIMTLETDQFLTPQNLSKLEPKEFNYDIVPFCWQAFFASGKPEYIRYIIQYAMEPPSGSDQDASRLTAKTTLLNFTETHPKIRQIAADYFATLPESVRKAFLGDQKNTGSKPRTAQPQPDNTSHES